jgi:hypothetical protein
MSESIQSIYMIGSDSRNGWLNTHTIIENEPHCDDFCEQNPEHILFHCEMYEQQRQNLKNKSIEKYGLFPCTAQQLINKDIYCIFKDFCKNVLS